MFCLLFSSVESLSFSFFIAVYQVTLALMQGREALFYPIFASEFQKMALREARFLRIDVVVEALLFYLYCWKSNPNIYSGPILKLTSLTSVLLKKFSQISDSPLGSMAQMLKFYNSCMSSFSVLERHGTFPTSISQKVTPMAHMSLLKLYSFLVNAQGDMKSGDPKFYFNAYEHLSASMAKPKSPIFSQSLTVRKRLSGLISLWMSPCEWMLLQPLMIWVKSVMAFSSFSFRCALSWSLSVPLGQSSVMMYMLFLVCSASFNSRILFLPFKTSKALIYVLASSIWSLALWISFETTLMATDCSALMILYLTFNRGPCRPGWRSRRRWCR